MEEPLRNSVAFCNNPIPKGPKGLGDIILYMRKRCQAVIRPNGGPTRYSQFCELFITPLYQILLIYWQNIAIKWKVKTVFICYDGLP